MASIATLILRSRFVHADGAIREMVLWRLPRPIPQRPHGFRFRLHYESADGRSLIRHDNETGKGDHCHVGGREERYRFGGVEVLVEDFLADIDRSRRGQNR